MTPQPKTTVARGQQRMVAPSSECL